TVTLTATVTPTRTLTPTPPFTPTAVPTATPGGEATSTPTASVPLPTSTRTLTPTSTAMPTATSTTTPTTGSAAADRSLGAGAPAMANDVAAIQSLITAIVSGFQFGGAAAFVDEPAGSAASSCPLGGTATRSCSGNVHVTITLAACKLPTSSGSASVT